MQPVQVNYVPKPEERWRLYFNSKNAAPVVCSLDNGESTTEFSVQQAQLHKIPEVWTRFEGKKKQPVFIVEFYGKLQMRFGVAHFFPLDLPIDAVEMERLLAEDHQ